jgi:ribonucleoside-diphosphate reductase alpha chain
MLEGYGERFTTRVAVAPTTSSSFILGQVSPSIEPLHSNYFLKDLAKGKFSYKNPYLEKLLKEKGLDTPEVWKSIMVKGGSVQHIDELTQREKDVFKTFGEISQMEIVKQAAQRQRWIDQAQSLNLMIHPDVPLKDVNSLFIEAWKLGLKTLYYQRSVNIAQQVSRDILNCASCEA